MKKLNRYLHEPVNALTHLAGALAALAGTVLLVYLTWEEPQKMVSLLIYGVSTTGLFAASTLFHGVKTSSRVRMRLNRLDHAAIFLVIAGTYTPIAYNVYPAAWRWGVLGVTWSAAAVGVAYKMTSPHIHGFLNRTIYPVLAWAGVVPLMVDRSFLQELPSRALLLLLLGGVIYSVGFLIYYSRRPNPWRHFGHHEIWHLCVLGGSLCHYLFILWHIVPAVRPV